MNDPAVAFVVGLFVGEVTMALFLYFCVIRPLAKKGDPDDN